MLTTQPLADGSLGELITALLAFSASGIPATAAISTKRSRHSALLTEVSVQWDPNAVEEPTDEPPITSGGPPIPRSSDRAAEADGRGHGAPAS